MSCRDKDTLGYLEYPSSKLIKYMDIVQVILKNQKALITLVGCILIIKWINS